MLAELHTDPAALARTRERNIFSDRDWALLRIDPPMSTPALDRFTHDPVPGESAWLIGFPDHYLPEGWRNELRWPLAEGWTPPTPLVFVGTISRVREGMLDLRLEGRLTSFGGASGSGVFVRRDGKLAAVGVASQALIGSPIVSVTRLPRMEQLLPLARSPRPDAPDGVR